MDETGKDVITLETLAGPVIAKRGANGVVSIDMGPARDDWRQIPMSAEADTLHVPIIVGPLADAVAVNVGNPHAVFFVDDARAIDLADVGPKIEHHTLFPQRTNVEAVEVVNRSHIRMRVWERGAGITQACGTGACASAVAAMRRGLTDRRVTVTLDGGDLEIEWRADGHAIMTGPVAESFTGVLDRSLLT
jgi:diaminopimelate epimerase